jgi:hypothetical protein
MSPNNFSAICSTKKEYLSMERLNVMLHVYTQGILFNKINCYAVIHEIWLAQKRLLIVAPRADNIQQLLINVLF